MKYLASLLIISAAFVWSCSSEEMGSAKVQVVLVDAPGDYDAVNIDIQDVQVNSGADSSGWVSLESASMGVYDLLKLTNGEEAFLGEVELPGGSLSQIRLILGSDNELVVDSVAQQLTVPSGSQSGLKLNVNADIVEGVTYKLVIDFDVAKSIVKAGNSGKYNLKPVIRAEFEAVTGAIAGVVSPADAMIYAIQGSDTASTYSSESGEYMIRALSPGAYDISAIPADTSYLMSGVMAVDVQAGTITEMDSIKFELK